MITSIITELLLMKKKFDQLSLEAVKQPLEREDYRLHRFRR